MVPTRPRILFASTVAIFVLLLALPALAAGGELDPSWGGTGVVTTLVGEASFGEGVLARGNEVIAVGPAFTETDADFGIAQYRRDGTLDQSFGTGGTVTTNISNFDVATAAGYMGDKLVVVGYTSADFVQYDFALARYNEDGSLDQSFGTGGTVITDFGGEDIADAVLVTGNTIVVAGATTAGAGRDFALARYLKDGSLDPSFGGDGTVTTDFGSAFDAANGLDIVSNRVVAAGYTDFGTGDANFALARYRDDGSLDPSFDGDGRVETDFAGGDDLAHAIDIRGDAIVAMGQASSGTDQDLAAARYDRNGSLDPAFGGDGTSTIDAGGDDVAGGGAIQYDHRVVVAGGTPFGLFGDDFVVGRFLRDGSPDPSFGAGGSVTTPIGATSAAQALDLGPDNRIVAVGYTCAADEVTCEFAVARYLAN